jgi:Mn-containing catalase
MYHHIKQLMYTVRIGQPDPRFGNMLLEQFGGANGELAAAMQYSIQGLNCDDPERKDLLMDIGTEELSHLEVVGTLARMHLKPLKTNRKAAHEDPLIAIAGGGGGQRGQKSLEREKAGGVESSPGRGRDCCAR